MKTFKDNAGRTWTVGVNVDAIKRVRTVLDVNLMEAVEGDLLEQLSSDPVLLCDVIYVVCKPEADAQSVSDEDFGRAMAGDAIEHATTALLEELVDFFPRGKRRVLHKALAKLQAVEARAVEYAQARLEDPELDRRIEAALSSPTDLSSSLPPSPE
ncbi:MAG: hypothetical protein HON70_25395 [Lentisphaerae bacterium]|jgi:NAD-dependent oxidoreductase involved in siderophore biosynthesis|nr:hypothetical protein [Lentisphaerota bacterium]